MFKPGIWKKLHYSPRLCEVNCLLESISGSHISLSAEPYRYHFIIPANKTAFPNITNPIISELWGRWSKRSFHQFPGWGGCSPSAHLDKTFHLIWVHTLPLSEESSVSSRPPLTTELITCIKYTPQTQEGGANCSKIFC